MQLNLTHLQLSPRSFPLHSLHKSDHLPEPLLKEQFYHSSSYVAKNLDIYHSPLPSNPTASPLKSTS